MVKKVYKINFKIKKEKVILSVPASVVTTKNIEIPSTDPNEIRSIVNLQASRHTPFARDEIQVGYIKLGETPSNYTKVLLAIVKQDMIKKQVGLLDQLGLKVSEVVFPAEGVGRFLSSKIEGEGPVGIVDVGKYSSNFFILCEGKPVISRNIPVGRSQMQEQGEPIQANLIAEINATLASYQSDDIGALPAKYVLTTSDELMETFKAALFAQLGAEVEILSYVDFIKADTKVLQNLAETHSEHSFLDLVAVAALEAVPQIDLLPDDIVQEKKIKEAF